MRRWEFVGGGSAKYWEAGRAGLTVTVRFGRIGATGQSKTRDFPSELVALAHLKKLIAEKEAKGYRAIGPVTAPPPAPAAEIPAEIPAEVPVEVPVESLWDEAFVFPEEWRATLRPRRGGTPGPAIELDPDAERRHDTYLRDAADEVDGLLHQRSSDQRLTTAARAALRHEPDPLGAAVLASVVASWLFRRSQGSRPGEIARIADAWIARHGYGFAAAAAAELGSITVDRRRNDPPFVRERRGGDSQRGWTTEPIVHRLRALLAVAPDDGYADAVDALATRRSPGLQGAVACYLVPTRLDWLDERCALVARMEAPDEVGALLLCSLGSAGQLPVLDGAESLYWPLGRPEVRNTMLDGLGPALVPLLAAAADQDPDAGERRRDILGTLAALPADEAFRLLVARLDQKDGPQAVSEAARRFPVRALRLLSEAAAGSPRAGELLATHVLAHRELAIATLPDLPPAAHRQLATVLDATARVADAPADALPELLVRPPWTRPRTAAEPVVIEGLTPAGPPTLAWQPGERESWAAEVVGPSVWNGVVDWPAAIEKFYAGRRNSQQILELFALGPAELVRPLFDRWGALGLVGALPTPKLVVARFGLEALPLALDIARSNAAAGYAELLAPFVSVEVAEQMADWLAKARSVRPAALGWLDRHRLAATRILVPAALGRSVARRRRAEAALRAIASIGPSADLIEVAAEYGERAAAAIAELVTADPLDVVRPPVLGDWVDPARLPQILLRDQESGLPTVAVGHLLTMLALSTPDGGCAGLPGVLAVSDRRSLAEFGWALFQGWQAAGSPAGDGWALTALGWLGDDDTVRRLTPIVRAWPGEGGHRRAVAGLDVLAMIGSDLALTHLDGIARKVKFKALRARAQEKIAEVAAGRGLSAEQLADRLVPDFGLTEPDGDTLDFGPRRFTIDFDELGRPVVVDETGRRRKDLPKPNATDDPARAATAVARFAALKKEARPVATDQVHRLADAMLSRRDWTWRELRELLLGHPLLGRLARWLVWCAGERSFRLTDGGVPVDVRGQELSLSESDLVRLAHPVLLGDALAGWVAAFGPIAQPFPQLQRPVYALTEPERTATELDRFHGLTVPTGKALGLQRRGWLRAQPQDNGVEPWIYRPLPDNRAVQVLLDPGIQVGALDTLPEQRITSVRLTTNPHRDTRPPNLPFGSLDPLTASELLTDLINLAT